LVAVVRLLAITAVAFVRADRACVGWGLDWLPDGAAHFASIRGRKPVWIFAPEGKLPSVSRSSFDQDNILLFNARIHEDVEEGLPIASLAIRVWDLCH